MDVLRDFPLKIFSAGSKVAKEYANDFVANGCYVVDLSSEYRYDDQVPLIIPEIIQVLYFFIISLIFLSGSFSILEQLIVMSFFLSIFFQI